ncbi:MAG: ABC transporter permease, partial [Caldilineaceae bacterium]|nr:ABC transporter permease [Caldilineaceae bacterium]
MAEATPMRSPAAPAPPGAGATHTNENLRRSIRRFRRNPLSMIGLTILLVLVIIAVLAPQIVPYPEDATGNMRAASRLEPPGAEFWFGTDNVGRDIFSRVLMGTGLALRVGIVIIVLASAIGVTVGALAGYFGGWVDDLLMRLTDIFLTVPALVLAIAVTAALGKGMINVMIGIALVWWPGFARLTRGQVIQVRELEFVRATRALGASWPRLLMRHILPNILSPIIVE